MQKKVLELTFLCFPYILLILLSSIFEPWFIFLEKKLFISLCIIFLILQVFLYFAKFWNQWLENISFVVCSTFLILTILVFPVRNLNLGDGIILLESMYLESQVYGYQLILDEILEGLIHSTLTSWLATEDPRLAFRILSSLSGIVLIFYLLKKYFLKPNGLLSFLVITSSGGFLLFYGYVENYSLVTLFLFGFSFFILDKLQRSQKISTYLLGLLSSIGALLHLVFGYMIFALVYLNFIWSQKRNFWKNAIVSSFIAGLVLLVVYGYFLFFSQLRLDLSLGHITNPKFYPIKRWISTQHFKEIFYCLTFSSLPSLVILGYIYFFDKLTWKKQSLTREFQFLRWSIFGFFLHAFFFNPQLGFPRDWDLMSFYWIPLSLLTANLLQHTQFPPNKILPILCFSLVLLILNAKALNVIDPRQEKELSTVIQKIQNFSKEYKTKIHQIPAKERKFHLKTEFFFYRTLKDLEEKKAPEDLVQTGESLLAELNERQGNFSKAWKKDYLSRATKYHEEYLKFKESQP